MRVLAESLASHLAQNYHYPCSYDQLLPGKRPGLGKQGWQLKCVAAGHKMRDQLQLDPTVAIAWTRWTKLTGGMSCRWWMECCWGPYNGRVQAKEWTDDERRIVSRGCLKFHGLAWGWRAIAECELLERKQRSGKFPAPCQHMVVDSGNSVTQKKVWLLREVRAASWYLLKVFVLAPILCL